MIRNIVFDIGNVLTDFRWKEFMQDKGFDGETVKRIAKASLESPLWGELDRGLWEEEKVLEEFIRRDPEIEEQIRFAYSDIHGMVTPRDYAIPWIRELKQGGYGVYYLSNFAERACRECREALAFLGETDGGILSCQVHLIKPEPAIYRLLLKQYGLNAEECVFLDDLPVNVEGAKAEGFAGIVFRSREQAVEELALLGVTPGHRPDPRGCGCP